MIIFISYRRNQTQHIADRIYDRLREQFGPKCVFKDVNAIPLGKDFRREIRDAVGRCDVVLAVIGPEWCTALDKDGTRCLEKTVKVGRNKYSQFRHVPLCVRPLPELRGFVPAYVNNPG